MAIAYSPAALQRDLDFLEAKLRGSHPDLNMYTAEDRIDHCFDSLRSHLEDLRTDLQLVSAAAALYPLLGDGHTMFLPGPLTASRGTSAGYLPFDPVQVEGHLYVRRNGTSDGRLVPGAEVLAINGVPAAAILDTLMRRQVRDGHNTTFPAWILNNWFKEYYRLSFGEPARFSVDLGSASGRMTVIVPALPKDSIRANIARNHPDVGAENEVKPLLRIAADAHHAVLTIPTFDDLRDPGAPKRSGRALIHDAFGALRARKVQRIVLDLRGNQGGEPALAKLLLSYLLDEPFQLVWKGPASGTSRPQRDPFAGKLIVLMDGGSFSVTGMVLSCLERHGRATFIGEEAGGNRTIIAGSPKHLRLPNTGMDCYISTRLWRMVDRPNDGHGVMPTIPVSPTIDDIIDGRDPVMEAALKAFE
jgi:Peptidase family S41